MWQSFGEYLLDLIGNRKVKIAEIAVGKFDKIYKILEEKKNIDVIKTDIDPDNENIIKDDITNPNFDLYKEVCLIYSIRPPNELQPYLVNLANEINCQLIIKTLTNEDLNTGRFNMKLKNYKKASFYTLWW